MASEIKFIKEIEDGETWYHTEVNGHLKTNSYSKDESEARSVYERIKKGLIEGKVVEVLEFETV
jgi:hypothetical protein